MDREELKNYEFKSGEINYTSLTTHEIEVLQELKIWEGCDYRIIR